MRYWFGSEDQERNDYPNDYSPSVRMHQTPGRQVPDRTSCLGFVANRFRLLPSSYSYVLLETMRRGALRGTKLEKSQCVTIRTKLLKIAAVVKESARRILFELPGSFPLSELWVLVATRLSGRASLESG